MVAFIEGRQPIPRGDSSAHEADEQVDEEVDEESALEYEDVPLELG